MAQSLNIGLQGTFTNLPFGICAIYFNLKVFLCISVIEIDVRIYLIPCPAGKFVSLPDAYYQLLYYALLSIWINRTINRFTNDTWTICITYIVVDFPSKSLPSPHPSSHQQKITSIKKTCQETSRNQNSLYIIPQSLEISLSSLAPNKTCPAQTVTAIISACHGGFFQDHTIAFHHRVHGCYLSRVDPSHTVDNGGSRERKCLRVLRSENPDERRKEHQGGSEITAKLPILPYGCPKN